MKRIRFLRVATYGALWVALSLGGVARAADELKIGFMATLSGSNAVIGKQLLDGFQLAVTQADGKLGGMVTEIVVVDDQQKPDIARQAVGKLIESDRTQVIVGMPFSNVLNAVYLPATQAKAILIGLSGAPSAIAGSSCSPYFFSSSWQGDTLAEAIGVGLQEKKIKRLYIMAPNFPGGREVVAGIKRFYKGEVVGEVYTPLSQLDFAAELAQLRAANPDAVFAFYPGGLGIQFVKQYAQAGLKATRPLYAAYTIDSTTLPAMGDAAIGVRTSEFWSASLDNPANRQFVEAFFKRYNYPPSSYAVQGYDAGRLLDVAIRQIGGKIDNRDVLVSALQAAKFKSVRGNFRFNNNHFPIQDLYLAEVRKGQDGVPVISLDNKVLHDHGDAYASSCTMK